MEKKSELKERAEEIEELVALVKNGDHAAFSTLYDIFVDPLHRYIYFRVNVDDVEDLLEIVFLKVWENIDKYRDEKASFSAWIFRIAHNLVVDYYRKSKDRENVELHVNIPDYKREHNPLKNIENELNKGVLREALLGLKKHYQEIIIYKFVNDFSNSEIAKIMGKTEGSLRILQFRALKALRRELVDKGINYTI